MTTDQDAKIREIAERHGLMMTTTDGKRKIPHPALREACDAGAKAQREQDASLNFAKLIEGHETNYHQSPTGGWVWACSCQAGTPLFLAYDTREECVLQTRLHWGGVIREAIRRGGKS